MIKKLALGFLVVFAFLLVIGIVVGLPQVRPVLIRQLGEVLQCPVTMQAVVWVPPTGLGVRALEAQSPAGRTQPPWFKAAAVDVRVALWSLLWRRAFVADVDVVRPTLTIEQLADGRASLPTWQPAPPAGGASASAASAPTPGLLPHHVRIQNGTIVYRDHRLTPTWEFVLDELRLDARVTPAGVQYQGAGTIESPQRMPVGTVEVRGSTGFDGQTSTTVTVVHQAVTELAPYVKQVMGAEPIAGALTLTATITGRPEALTAHIHVETRELAFPPAAMTSAGVSAAQLLPILEDDQHRIQFDFTVSGRWDQLQVSWNDLAASAVQQILRGLVTQRLPNVLLQGLTQALQPPAEGEAAGPLDLKALGKQLSKTLKGSLIPADSSQDTKSQQ